MNRQPPPWLRSPLDPALRRQARELYTVSGLTLRAIAKKLALPESTVFSWSSRDGWRDLRAASASANTTQSTTEAPRPDPASTTGASTACSHAHAYPRVGRPNTVDRESANAQPTPPAIPPSQLPTPAVAPVSPVLAHGWNPGQPGRDVMAIARTQRREWERYRAVLNAFRPPWQRL